jgi:hypothetical protein
MRVGDENAWNLDQKYGVIARHVPDWSYLTGTAASGNARDRNPKYGKRSIAASSSDRGAEEADE